MGVLPLLSLDLKSSPICLKKYILIGWSPCAATWTTLIPKLFTAYLSAPLSSRSWHRVVLPLNEQKCSAVKPSPVVLIFIKAVTCADFIVSVACRIIIFAIRSSLWKQASCKREYPLSSKTSSKQTSSFCLRIDAKFSWLPSSIAGKAAWIKSLSLF